MQLIIWVAYVRYRDAILEDDENIFPGELPKMTIVQAVAACIAVYSRSRLAIFRSGLDWNSTSIMYLEDVAVLWKLTMKVNFICRKKKWEA